MNCKSVLVYVAIFSTLIYVVTALTVGPTVTYNQNQTFEGSAGVEVNYTGNATDVSGGYIFYIDLNSKQQNPRWKGYVGNVTGTLVLADAQGFSIYDWTVTTSLSGEVFASRGSVINWTGINCTHTNATYWEDVAMNHTSPNDNISRTFNASDHDAFTVGTVSIAAGACVSINTFINGTPNSTDKFEEILLYDGGQTGLNQTDNTNFQNIVYTTIVEQDSLGFSNNTNGSTYDFQMIVAENGLSTWESSIAYYFFVELS
jgi:hypothetical protein